MSDPNANLGGLMRPSPVDVQPTNDPSEIKERESGFVRFFKRPEVISALTQFAAQAFQPIPPGQTTGGHLGTALAQGAGAAGRVVQQREQRELQERQLDFEERRIAVGEREAEVAETRAQTEAETAAAAAARGERDITLRENVADVTAQLQRDRLEFDRGTQASLNRSRRAEELFNQQQVQLSAARNEIERQRLQTQVDEAQRNRDAEAENLSQRLAVQMALAEDQQAVNLITAITKAEIQNSVITGQPPNVNKIIATVRTSLQAAGRLPAATVDPASGAAVTPAAPGSVSPLQAFDLNTLNPEEKQAIFASPANEAAARRAFGDERIDQIKQELQGTQ